MTSNPTIEIMELARDVDPRSADVVKLARLARNLAFDVYGGLDGDIATADAIFDLTKNWEEFDPDTQGPEVVRLARVLCGEVGSWFD